MTQTMTDSAMPFELVIGEEGALLGELAEIRSLIHTDVQRRQEERPVGRGGHRLWSTLGFWCGVGVLVGVLLLLLSIRLNSMPTLWLGVVFFLGSPTFWLASTIRAMWQEWNEHKLTAISQANESAAQQETLVKQLLHFQRASLFYAADELMHREARVSRHVSSYLGTSRAGGAVGLIAGLVALAVGMNKLLSEIQAMPTSLKEVAWAIFAAMVGLGMGAHLSANSQTVLLDYVELLRRIGSWKETVAKERKEAVEHLPK